ncbi:MAG TPA: hypothetical protein VGI46_11490 [Candidatus Acidoferrum sp.]
MEELLGKHSRKKEIVLFILDVVFFTAALVPSMPVLVRWFLWFSCWTITAALAQILFDAPKKIRWRVLVTIAAALLFVACFQSLACLQRREEKAAALKGELCSFRSFWGACYTPPIPIIEIGGDSGSKLVYVGSEDSVDFGKFARNAGLRIERGNHGMEISTPVLDRSGKRIANIDRNHWTVVAQPEIWDKNYTDNALEIKDSRGEVVLQLRFLPDRLQIAAEWRDQFGRGQEWAKCSAPGKPPSACVIPWGNARTELQNEQPIEPIFKYPSSEHLGELVKK